MAMLEALMNRMSRMELEDRSLSAVRKQVLQELPDITLVLAGGQRVSAHREVLAAASPVLGKQLGRRARHGGSCSRSRSRSRSRGRAELEVSSVDPTIAHALIRWMYTGALPVLDSSTFSARSFFQDHPDLADPIPDKATVRLGGLQQAFRAAEQLEMRELVQAILQDWGYA
eukprot:CAMPEP_0204337252 /NCGR_PEP_ID=MMETSP0469-20131031/20165_1 /ASSEMBLY_ACC=CAM_ASM_000384 /TAXON_ID=2969 /ORGANISM="Oxyrrhis marina" /LENGTH=171 /DNA_ID=CAMNT_0051321253 /DNA_START=1 /DNA_END=516 /DNA_ORIENTATION=+